MNIRERWEAAQARVDELRAELLAAVENDDFDVDQVARLEEQADEAATRADALERMIPFESEPVRAQEHDEHDREAVERPEVREEPMAPFNVNTRKDDDPFDMNELRFSTPPQDLRGRVHAALESDRMTAVGDREKQAIAETLRRADNARGDLARHILATGSDTYRRAFSKAVTGRGHMLTREEADALEFARAASLTDTAGGFTIPTTIDPTIVLTNDGTTNPFRRISRVVQTMTDNYNVINSAGVTASWDGEAAAVSDDAPTLANTTITPYKAQTAVPFSIEIGQDWVGMEQEMVRLITDAKDRLEGAAFATGTGTNQPVGIVTALDANTNVELAMTTGGVFGLVDVYAALEATGARFRQNASWVMNLVRLNEIRQFATANNYHGFTVDLTAENIPAVLGKPVYESSDMASGAYLTTTTTNAIVVGDFSNYVIVDRVGLSVEFVPHLFDTANPGLPTGQRAWYASWRVGADSVNDLAFTLLQNGTT